MWVSQRGVVRRQRNGAQHKSPIVSGWKNSGGKARRQGFLPGLGIHGTRLRVHHNSTPAFTPHLLAKNITYHLPPTQRDVTEHVTELGEHF